MCRSSLADGSGRPRVAGERVSARRMARRVLCARPSPVETLDASSFTKGINMFAAAPPMVP